MSETLILPDRNVVIEPPLIEDPTAPRMVADGGIVRLWDNRAAIMLYTKPLLVQTEAHQHICTIDLPRAGFDRSLICALFRWEPMPGWPGYLTMH